MAESSTWVKAFTQVGLATAACSVVGGLLTDPFATVWAGALAASSADLAKRAKAVNGTDAAPFVAYAAWCSFATLLSGTIARLNPES